MDRGELASERLTGLDRRRLLGGRRCLDRRPDLDRQPIPGRRAASVRGAVGQCGTIRFAKTGSWSATVVPVRIPVLLARFPFGPARAPAMSACAAWSACSPPEARAASTAACIRFSNASGSTARADDPGPFRAAPGTRLASGGVEPSSVIRFTPRIPCDSIA